MFRETIPSVALISVATDAAEDADPDDDEEATEDEETDREAADEVEPTKGKRKTA